MAGRRCELALVPCASQPCRHAGTCQPSANFSSFFCSCSTGWRGERNIILAFYVAVKLTRPIIFITYYFPIKCLLSILLILLCPLYQNNFTFTNMCHFHWMVSSFDACEGPQCETDIDECTRQPCHHGGKCENTPGAYRCLCHPGFSGHNCHLDIDECSPSKGQLDDGQLLGRRFGC